MTIGVTGNDSGGPPDEDQTLSIVEAVGASHGSVVSGGGALTYTPEADYFGSDGFSYTIRETSHRVKSNALEGLAIGGRDEVDASFGWASFTGKSSLQEPGATKSSGNHGFTVYVEERGTGRAGNDRIWVEVADKDGTPLPALSMPRAAPDHAVEIAGGNVVVPHESSDHDSDGVASIDDNCPGTVNPGQEDADGDHLGNACDGDDDGDGLGDAFELAHGFDPLVAGEGGLDADGDGLDGLAEQASGTDPHAIDSDRDGFSDGQEIVANSDPNDPASVPAIASVPGMSAWGLLVLALWMLITPYRIARRAQ